MSEYMDIFVRKGKTLDEEELTQIREFQKKWVLLSWRKVEEWFGFSQKILDSQLFMDIVIDYLRGAQGSFLKEIENIVLDSDMITWEKIEEIRDVYKKYDFLEDLLRVFLTCGNKIAVGSEYMKDKDWVKFRGGGSG